MVVVPVLRAGLGMLDAVLELIPTARVGHIGLQRDEMTAVASRIISKLPPDLSGSFVLMIDPMLATGGSAVAALDLIRGAGGRDVRMICIVAAPEGIALVEKHHPDAHIYTPAIDEGLNGTGPCRAWVTSGIGFRDLTIMKPRPTELDAATSASRRPERRQAGAASDVWRTALTCIEPNKILVRGYPLDEIMGRLKFGEAIYLLLVGEVPTPGIGRLMDAHLVSFFDHGATPRRPGCTQYRHHRRAAARVRRRGRARLRAVSRR